MSDAIEEKLKQEYKKSFISYFEVCPKVYKSESDKIFSTTGAKKSTAEILRFDIDFAVDFNIKIIDKAIYWAKKYHGEQKRKGGEPYYTHPLEVARKVIPCIIDVQVVVAAILHDIVEDTEVTVEMIQGTFGQRIAEMVDMLTRDRPDGTKLSVEEILNNARNQNSTTGDGVCFIKIMDRLHNLETLSAMPVEKQIKIARETIDVVLPVCIFLSQMYENCHNGSYLLNTSKQLINLSTQYV